MKILKKFEANKNNFVELRLLVQGDEIWYEIFEKHGSSSGQGWMRRKELQDAEKLYDDKVKYLKKYYM